MKGCSRCKESLPTSEFRKDASRVDGLSYWCKTCASAYRAEHYRRTRERAAELGALWRAANPEAVAAIGRRWRAENRDKVRAKHKRRYDRLRIADPQRLRNQAVERQQRRRARLKGVATEVIDRSQVFKRDGWVCQLCQLPVDPKVRWPDPQSPSLDHRLPIAQGGSHTYENVQLAHLVCNQVKGAAA